VLLGLYCRIEALPDEDYMKIKNFKIFRAQTGHYRKLKQVKSRRLEAGSTIYQLQELLAYEKSFTLLMGNYTPVFPIIII